MTRTAQAAGSCIWGICQEQAGGLGEGRSEIYQASLSGLVLWKAVCSPGLLGNQTPTASRDADISCPSA